MQSIFEDLWNGNTAPYKDCGRYDPEVEELADLLERNKKNLDDVLNEEQKSLLKSYIACGQEHSYPLIVHAFREGFSLACRLMAQMQIKY